MYKYSEIPRLYGKPLRIICVGYQEFELTKFPKMQIFGDVSVEKRQFLDLAKKLKIEYVKFSDFISSDSI